MPNQAVPVMLSCRNPKATMGIASSSIPDCPLRRRPASEILSDIILPTIKYIKGL